MTKLNKSSILRCNLSETQIQMEIIVDIWRYEVTKIVVRELVSLLTQKFYRTEVKDHLSTGNKKKVEFLIKNQYLSTTQKQKL